MPALWLSSLVILKLTKRQDIMFVGALKLPKHHIDRNWKIYHWKMWQVLTHFTKYKVQKFSNNSASLPDELNLLFACFKDLNTEPWTMLEMTPDEIKQTLTLTLTQVYKSLSRVNLHNEGPGNIPEHILKQESHKHLRWHEGE